MATPEIALTHLDEPLFDGANATKRDLIDYLDAVAERILPGLRGRPLSVIRVRAGQQPFMQKNVPSYAPSFVRTVTMWAESSRREVRYALCEDKPTLIWFGNQRAVEYHVTLVTTEHMDRPSYLVLDIDPPSGQAFGKAVAAARLVQQALTDVGLSGAVKTSGAKGLHVYVPVDASGNDAAAATRALAARAEKLDPELATTAFVRADREGKVFLDSTRSHGATVVACYSPRVRPGVPVSFPVSWESLDDVSPGDFTIQNAAALVADSDPWASALPSPQRLPASLVEEGNAIPIARVQAMHEGKRRARASRGSLRDYGLGESGRDDVLGLRALRTLRDVERDLLVLLQRPEPRGVNGRVVDEDVRAAAVLSDEAEPLFRVEPLHCPCRHDAFPFGVPGPAQGGRMSNRILARPRARRYPRYRPSLAPARVRLVTVAHHHGRAAAGGQRAAAGGQRAGGGSRRRAAAKGRQAVACGRRQPAAAGGGGCEAAGDRRRAGRRHGPQAAGQVRRQAEQIRQVISVSGHEQRIIVDGYPPKFGG
jgi:DNA ligase D-like protein (predicted polymerase)